MQAAKITPDGLKCIDELQSTGIKASSRALKFDIQDLGVEKHKNNQNTINKKKIPVFS